MDHITLTDLLIILAAGLVAGLLCRRIGVSLLVGYLVTGALIGPGGFGVVTGKQHEIEYIAEFGVLLLLFSIGLEFSLEDLKKLGGLMIVAGTIQMGVVASAVYALSMAMGLVWKEALIIGLAAAMSSTVLVFKTLTDYGLTTSRAGLRSVGILLFQDIAVVPLLLLIPILASEGEDASSPSYFILSLVSVGFIVGIVLLKFVVGRLFVPFLAQLRSPELLVLFSIVFLGTLVFAVHKVHLPLPLGAYAAGMILSGNRLTAQIDALLLSFRETFLAVFFVGLGLLFKPELVWTEPVFVIFGTLAILLLKTIAATAAARATGLSWRSAFGTGLGLSQVGEFALVVAFAALHAEVLLDQRHYDRLLIIALATLLLTPPLLRLGIKVTHAHEWITEGRRKISKAVADAKHALVFGIGPVGYRVVKDLHARGVKVCAIDRSPVNLHDLAQRGFRTFVGDGRDGTLLENAQVDEVDIVVVCVPDDEVARQIVSVIRELNATCAIVVRCRYLSKAKQIERAGASIAVSEEAGASSLLLKALDQLGGRSERLEQAATAAK